MSWDILIFNSKEQIDLETVNLPNFKSRQECIDKIKNSFLEIDFTDTSFGQLENQLAIIEFNLGSEDEMSSNFMLHVRGGENPTGEIARMCKENEWQAFDISEGNYIDTDAPQSDSFERWNNYKDYVIRQSSHDKKSWWKFW